MAELAVIGSIVSGIGSVVGGVSARNDAYAEAAQLEQRGTEELAASQRTMFEKRREGELLNSTLQARAAASGGGALDSTIVRLMSGITSRAEYGAQTELYGGLSRRAGMNDNAAARRRSGNAALVGSLFEGFGKAAGAFK